MEGLLNAFGWAAWGPVLVVALPAAVVGLMVRASARRRVEAIALTTAARRRVADVRAGLVTVEGTWRAPRGGGDGLVEDESGAAVLVTRDASAEAIADGTPVLVVGCAGPDDSGGDDPRGSGYRGHARLPRVVACGVGHFVSTDPALLEREERWARRRATVGAALFAAAVGIAAMAAMVAWRATD
ncbi:MAG TPA: hypothetical protein VF334_01525 [Polyangia bacterium]